MTGHALFLVGPTAVGKTDLSLRIAAELPVEIVNADALQLVRGLDIGTGKPSLEERSRAPHHLFDVIDPRDRMSAGDYARLARPVIEAIPERGRWPIVVGGSGFYLQALVHGLADLPEPDLALREDLRQRWEAEGPADLWAELESVDPGTARRLEPRDRQRVLRALEIWEQTGRPMSRWLEENPPIGASFTGDWIGLDLPADELSARIGRRVAKMVAEGWREEIRALLEAGVPCEASGFQAIGYREMLRAVQGECTLEQAIEATVRSTRRYAKRQRTWFRRWKHIEWHSARAPESTLSRALEMRRRALERASPP